MSIELNSISPPVEPQSVVNETGTNNEPIDEGRQELVRYLTQRPVSAEIRKHIISLVKTGMVKREYLVQFMDDIRQWQLRESNFPKFWTNKPIDVDDEPYVWRGIIVTDQYARLVIDEVKKIGLRWYIRIDKYYGHSLWIDWSGLVVK